jgi:RNA polymerase sigma factor (sigma-70 family)
MIKDDYNDGQVWLSFVNGDRLAFEHIYHFYFEKLCDFGLRLLADKEIVRDCVQDLFVKLWQNRDNLEGVKSPKSYLFAAIRNSVLNVAASPAHRVGRVNPKENEPHFILEYSPEEQLIGSQTDTEKNRQVLEALNALTDRQKECIYLRYYIGLEYDEIAELMQVSKKASYKLTARALEVLKESVRGNLHLFWFM